MMNTDFCRNAFCSLLSEAQRERVCSRCFPVNLIKGQKISIRTQQNCSIIVLSGLLACLTFNTQNDPITTDLYAEGDFLAYFAFAPESVSPFTPEGVVQCIKEASVIMLPNSVIRELFRLDPAIAEYMIRAANQAHFRSSVYLHQVMQQDAYHALSYLLDYCKSHHVPRLTYDELAAISNLHRVTVTRTMKEILKKEDFRA